MNEQQARLALIEILEQQAGIAEQLMAEARCLLDDQGDQEGYKRKLEQRTGLILELPEKLEAMIQCLSAGDCGLVESWIGELVEDAGHARQVDSVFYMSVLLYDGPEDGMSTNDIGRLADKLRQE